jgi:hypothetical protein
MAHQDEVDFQPEAADPNEPSMVFDSDEVELADAPITWRWAKSVDMAALRICHFHSEVAAGKALYLPDQPSDQRTIAVAEKGGHIIGGAILEDAIAVTMIGMERSVAESAYDAVIPIILTLARNEGTRLVEVRLPAGDKFDLQTGVETGREKPVA